MTYSHPNLVWYNNQGDFINFAYNSSVDRYEGDLIFDDNSSDTYKTIGLYLFEKIDAFEYQNPPALNLRKFQLFNEYGFFFYGNKNQNQQIDLIEPANNEPNYYSKWIWGYNFERLFPIGTVLMFDYPIFEFVNPNQTYVVVSTKKGAVLIISLLDNQSFSTTYAGQYNNPSSYVGKTISGANIIGVYNYINSSTFAENLSNWNERDFYSRYFLDRPLCLVNTKKNNKVNVISTSDTGSTSDVVNVTNPNLNDNVHYEYSAPQTSLPTDQSLIIELITKTDLDLLYDGDVNFVSSENRLYINPTIGYPTLLKPGQEFKVVGSSLNIDFYHVNTIPTFVGNSQLVFYPTQSQVLWNNRIYQCLSAYTQSSLTDITPDSATMWGYPTYVSISEPVSDEILLSSQIYLTTDHFYFQQPFTQSSEVTMAYAAQTFMNTFNQFNVELYYSTGSIRADLVYASPYAEVNFYQTKIGPTYSIGSLTTNYERIVRVEETLVNELNYDYSDNFNYSIVFTKLDEYGIVIKINKEIYQQEIELVYSLGVLDQQRTIDKTIRSWVTKWAPALSTLGILITLSYVDATPPFYNTITIDTQYPNVPLNFTVLVGTEAEYYIEDKTVTFYDMGTYLSIGINNHSYGISVATASTMTASFVPDIIPTLASWIDTYYDIILAYGITVTQFNQMLKFTVKKQTTQVNITVNSGKVSLPGIPLYTITNKIRGNQGPIITSNEIVLTNTDSFEDAGFSTGQVVNINNTIYPYDNQQYDIIYLDPQMMNLSYQGPFWGLTGSLCSSSPYVTIGFSNGFGATGCSGPYIPPTNIGGQFNPLQFSYAYNLEFFNTNTYSVNTYNLNPYPGTDGLADILWVSLSNSLYALGDNIVVMDSTSATYITTINLPGNTSSIALRFNNRNNLLYALSSSYMWAIDPILNSVIQSWTLSYPGYDIDINTKTTSAGWGDIYVTHGNSITNIWDYTNPNAPIVTVNSFPANVFKIAYNEFHDDFYGTTDFGIVGRISGQTRVPYMGGFTIPGLTHSMMYDPIQKSIYVAGSNLYQILNGVVISVPSASTGAFNDIIYNNISGNIDVSNSTTAFYGIDSSNNFNFNTYVGNWGYLALNEYDGDVYMSSQPQNAIYVIDSNDGTVKFSAPLTAGSTKIIYDPNRGSIWAIQPSINSLVEIQVTVNTSVIATPIIYTQSNQNNMYGTLDPDYVPPVDLWLNTLDHIRQPRENFTGQPRVEYYYRWFSDNVPQMFMYDISGDQLPTTGPYAYVGPKPLPLEDIFLNWNPNTNILRVGDPAVQQTVFATVSFTLDYIDDIYDISVTPQPMQLFLGYNSPEEGALRSILQLYKREHITLTFSYTNLNNNIITLTTIKTDTDLYGTITLDTNSNDLFYNTSSPNPDLKPGQIIAIFLTDITNRRNQYISSNNALIVQIRTVNSRQIIVDFLNPETDFFVTESTLVQDYPSEGYQTSLRFVLQVLDKELARFTIYGQTEVEDERFSIELGNVGHNINGNQAYIFKEYDIKEQGIDWIYLNKKRKELLMNRHFIFPFVGSYLPIINSINFFGFNDLLLYEYYRNINTSSPLFGQLFKVEIPDIFDNTVSGWNDQDFIKTTLPNPNYEGTNLFNLTYLITDIQGNNLLPYSVEEVQIKLSGLKKWLQTNVIPITHKILDITGKADFVGTTNISHIQRYATIINQVQNLTPVMFKLDEAYLLPVSSGSTVYNCVLDFTIQSTASLPSYFTIDIRTYRTYKEWEPWVEYQIGDKVSYYGKLYQSLSGENKINNPRKYENIPLWVSGTLYDVADLVDYERNTYVYTALGITQSLTQSFATFSVISPVSDPDNWQRVNFWVELDWEPVQTLKEYRNIQNITSTSSILPYNFTIDTSVDPYVTIGVCSNNGYGAVYNDKKNYEIRGLSLKLDPVRYIDPIGPFVPINVIV